ncbi:MAG: hypothetical protein Q7U34_03145 [Anaerolineales bacterium]|nr:hypothetical protein [Anaerolineales bacterium]
MISGLCFVEGAFDGEAAAVEDVPFDYPFVPQGMAQDRGVDHGGFHILVAEQFLDGADTCPDRRCWVS